jgi:exonuclease SbcC
LRPIELTIEGFGCFRKPVTINFEGLDVFAITGRTGSGKSTIMDAMGFALYGRVPRGSDPSELVANGASVLRVSFEFAAGEERYRIGRAVTVSPRTNKVMPARIQIERLLPDQTWEPLEDKVRQATTEVSRIVGLDFDGFQRCVLLPQGKFSEMLTGEPKKRRAVLEELLDAQIYERIMQRANSRAKLDQQLAQAKQQLLDSTFKDATQAALDAAHLVLEDQRPRLAAAQVTLEASQKAATYAQTVREARANEKQKRAELEQIAERTAQVEAANAKGQQRLAALAAAIAEAQSELAALAYDDALHHALSAAEVLSGQVESLRQKAAAAQQRANDVSEVERCKVDEVQAAAVLRGAVAAVEAGEQALEGARVAHAAAALQRGLKAGDPCPVCGGTVGKLPSMKASEVERAESAVKRAKAEEKKAATAAAAAEKRAALAERSLADAASVAAEIERDLQAASVDLVARLPEGVDASLDAISTRKAELEAATRRKTEKEQDIEVASLDRDRAAAELEGATREFSELKGKQMALVEQAEADRATGDAALDDLRTIVDRMQWEEIAGRIDEKKDPTALIDALRAGAQRDCDVLGRGIGQLEERAEKIAAQIEQAKEHRAELETARASAGLHAQLADILKADKFRDWYIGEAMGMLAEAATRRLATLDSEQRYELIVRNNAFWVIDQWDGGAERTADTLSGGETFVVSLALALALAEQLPLIQDQAGTALESLFLDEGFGSLDPDALEPVINAIDGLRQEGRTVGIITHVSELAQRLDRRIEVHKSQGGSTVTVAA